MYLSLHLTSDLENLLINAYSNGEYLCSFIKILR